MAAPPETAGRMFEEAAGLAVLAAIYPPAMLVAALFLASERPGKTTALYVLGGFVIVAVIGTAAFFLLRAGGFKLPSHQHTRYGLRLALGVIALAGAVVLIRRKPKPKQADPGKPAKPSLIDRMSATPRPRTAFLAGIIMFGPSLTFVAAVEVVATAQAGTAAAVGAMVMIYVIVLSFAWVPLVAYLIAPVTTVARLRAFDGWLRRNGRKLLAGAIGLVGVALVVQGIIGLT